MQAPGYYPQLAQRLLALGEEREALFVKMLADYNLTLKLLQDIKAGTVDVQQVIVSDDGWNLMEPEPEEA